LEQVRERKGPLKLGSESHEQIQVGRKTRTKNNLIATEKKIERKRKRTTNFIVEGSRTHWHRDQTVPFVSIQIVTPGLPSSLVGRFDFISTVTTAWSSLGQPM
jgi:hypothetical protein